MDQRLRTRHARSPSWLVLAALPVVGLTPSESLAQSVAAMSIRSAERARADERLAADRFGQRPSAMDQPQAGQGPDLPEPDSFWSGWNGAVHVGVNGSSGNSETFNLRLVFNARRLTDTMETTADGAYSWTSDDGSQSRNRGEFNLRNDWKLGESRWFIFGVAKAEYDEFQDWRWRLSGILGPGYTLVRDEKTTFKLRAGFGLSREFGGSRADLVPELDLGADFQRIISERQKIFATHDTYPAAEDFSDFRTVTKAGWEILVDPEANLTFRLGIEHRYQSKPGENFKSSDLDYFALLGWNF